MGLWLLSPQQLNLLQPTGDQKHYHNIKSIHVYFMYVLCTVFLQCSKLEEKYLRENTLQYLSKKSVYLDQHSSNSSCLGGQLYSQSHDCSLLSRVDLKICILALQSKLSLIVKVVIYVSRLLLYRLTVQPDSLLFLPLCLFMSFFGFKDTLDFLATCVWAQPILQGPGQVHGYWKP